jgi:hypothetical protein
LAVHTSPTEFTGRAQFTHTESVVAVQLDAYLPGAHAGAEHWTHVMPERKRPGAHWKAQPSVHAYAPMGAGHPMQKVSAKALHAIA